LDDAARKKKRKRIQKERVDISSNTTNNASPVVSAEKKDLAAKKGPNKFQQQRNRKRPIHQEVSEEDVQKQVKDTLAA
jgi:translation initiation factor IF-2